MRHTLQFIGMMVAALLLAWGIRTYAFTLFRVNGPGVPPQLTTGDWVFVNRLSTATFAKGNWVVFNAEIPAIGRIDALPGDTILFRGNAYRIPPVCCNRCRCADCRLFLLTVENARRLVYRHEFLGKAYPVKW